MVMQLPIAKLGSLLIKTLAKPMAKRVKSTFQQSAITKSMLVTLGQASHIVTTRMTIWSAGYKVRSIQPLDADKALSQGADLIGEAFIFGVGGAIVVWEYNKSKEKERHKEEKATLYKQMQEEQLNSLETKLYALEKTVETNQIQLLQILEEQRLNTLTVDESYIKRKSGWFW